MHGPADGRLTHSHYALCGYYCCWVVVNQSLRVSLNVTVVADQAVESDWSEYFLLVLLRSSTDQLLNYLIGLSVSLDRGTIMLSMVVLQSLVTPRYHRLLIRSGLSG